MASSSKICCICDEPITEANPSVKIQCKGFNALIRTSARCDDGKFQRVQGEDDESSASKVFVHKDCQRCYTRKWDVEATELEKKKSVEVEVSYN